MGSSKYNHTEYINFLGLARNPFPMAPDDTDFFMSEHTADMIERLIYAILTRKGFMLLTGEIGLGKTTLTRRIVKGLAKNHVETALVLQSFYQETDLIVAINRDFGLFDDDTGLTRQMEMLNRFLIEKNRVGVNCAVIIDDAQALSKKSLELIRMISNLEADQEKLVQILLVGQTELKETLQAHDLRQLRSRVAVWEEPKALTRAQIDSYIQFKLNRAGDNGRISIEKKALDKLYKLSFGNFRRINIIMDQALHHAFMDQTLTVKKKYVDDVFIEEPAEESSARRSLFVSFILVFLIMIAGWGIGGFLFYRFNIQPLDRTADVAPPPEIVIRKAIPRPAAHPAGNGSEPVMGIAPRSDLHSQADAPDDSAAFSPPSTAGSQAPTHRLAGGDNTSADDPVLKFLLAYHLEEFHSAFSQSLESGSIEEISRQIYSRTGLELIRLGDLPEKIENQYHMLAIDTGMPTKTTHYLFWKPSIVIPTYFQGYRGKEIKTLQTMLRQLKLYDYNIDGIVGVKSTRSIVSFQEQFGLEVTGYPDASTLFLLTRLTDTGV